MIQPRHIRSFLKLRVIAIIGLLILVGFDLASTLQSPSHVEAVPVSQLKNDGISPDYTTKIALMRSDDSVMDNPVALDQELSSEQIIELAYRALDLHGGLDDLLFPGANVVIKPNIVEMAPLENGVNTDPRIIEGLIMWMEDNGPGDLNYTVAEAAGGWLSSAMRNTRFNTGGATVGDGLALAGYKAMQQRLAAKGVDVVLLDANFGTPDEPLEGIRLVQTPEWIDFPEYPSYWVHEAILDADVLINVPVMKIHNTNITVCLKNYIGTAAGAKYGTYKGIGGPAPGDPPGLHQNYPEQNSVEHEIIDLASIAPADYCLIDATICKERAKTKDSPSVRRNMVLAGTDMVALDSVCALLMGLNPEDVSHLHTAAREGFGTMDLDKIEVLSEHSLKESLFYFERTKSGDSGNRGHFGTSNRVWLVNKFDGIDIDGQYFDVPDKDVIATPQQSGWTEPIYFSDDIIDFEGYYGAANSGVYYAFCWLTVPQEQDAELWIAHDEACAVWIDGEQVYHNDSSYQNFGLPGGPTKKIHLKAGRQPLLVKLVDRNRTAPFAMNLCRILPTHLPTGQATYTDLRSSKNYQRYEGTRILGLQFSAVGQESGVHQWKTY